MTEIAKAYVQIVPTTEGIGSKVTSALNGELAGSGEASGGSWASKFISMAKKTIAAAGIGKIISEAINAGADFEQNVGGIETLFGARGAKSVEEYAQIVGKTVEEVTGEYEKLHAAEEQMMTYANEAYSSAGMSANEYMETVTSFAASLKQSVGGDMEALTSTANMAVIDMADNANKMGTSIESIQNAYQGFAKQNYTMLDNLKLGYGGTKEEMQRLLEDAEKISGIHYDISNLNDVYNAIHVIQTDLGITGTTAEEAAATFSGSMASMKAAAENVLAALTTGENLPASLAALNDTVRTFLIDNLVPMIANLLGSIPQLVGDLGGMIIGLLNTASEHADEVVAFGADLIANIITGLTENGPALLASMGNLVISIGKALIEFDWLTTVQNMITEIKNNLDVFAGEFLGSDESIGLAVIDSITEKLPEILIKGNEIIDNIVNGIAEKLPTLLENAALVMSEMISKIAESLPQVLDMGAEVLLNIITGITSKLPDIAATAGTIIANLLQEIVNHLPELFSSGVDIVGNIISGLGESIGNIITAAGELIAAIIGAFGDVDWLDLGKNIIDGIINGMGELLWNLLESAKNVALSVWQTVKDVLGIASPSKKFAELGRFTMMGFAGGIEGSEDLVKDAIKDVSGMATASVDINSFGTGTFGKIAADRADQEASILNAVYAIGNRIVKAIEDKDSNSYMDGKKVTDLISKYQNRAARATGV